MYDWWLPHDAGIIDLHPPPDSRVVSFESTPVSLSKESPVGEALFDGSVEARIEAVKHAYSWRELKDVVVEGFWVLGIIGAVTPNDQPNKVSVSVSVGGQNLVAAGFTATSRVLLRFPIRLRDNKSKVEVCLEWGGPCDVNVIAATTLSYSQIWHVTAPQLVGLVWEMCLEEKRVELELMAPCEDEF